MAVMVGFDRKAIIALVTFICIVLFIQLRSHNPSEPAQTHSPSPIQNSTTIQNSPPPVKSWEFDPRRDERNFGLDEEQCDSSFPGLWYEIERAVEHRHHEGRITLEDVDKSVGGPDTIRVLIYDRQMYIIEDHSVDQKSRAASILSSIHRAITSYPHHIPNVEFTLCSSDGPSAPNQWALTREINEDNSTWVITDHVWWTWPVPLIGEFTEVRRKIAQTEPDWEEKIPQLTWRGVVDLGTVRENLVKASEKKPWSDVRGMFWAGRGGTEGATKETKDDALLISDHCKYQYLVYTEGHTYSGRFKYLHQCNSVIITHKLKWAEYHSALMKFDGPDQNMIEVERDFSDLDEKMEHLLQNPEKARQIAENNVKVFRNRYLTPASQACYVRKLISSWRKVQAFEPLLWKDEVDNEGVKHQVLRGQPFETWIIMPMV